MKRRYILSFIPRVFNTAFKNVRVIQEIPAFSIYLIVELIFENSQFGFKVLRFSTR